MLQYIYVLNEAFIIKYLFDQFITKLSKIYYSYLQFFIISNIIDSVFYLTLAFKHKPNIKSGLIIFSYYFQSSILLIRINLINFFRYYCCIF